GGFDRNGDGMLAGRGGDGIFEGVDQLFNPHRVVRRQLIVIQESSHVAVGCAVDVDSERGERLPFGGEERVLDDRGVGLIRSRATRRHGAGPWKDFRTNSSPPTAAAVSTETAGTKRLVFLI